MALATIAWEAGPRAARRHLDQSALGAIEIARPALDDLPYRNFVRTLLRAQGFKLDCNRLEPDAALALVSDQFLSPGAFRREQALLAADIAALADYAGQLVGAKAAVSLRTYFAPGDLVWHVDRVNQADAFRLLWPLGRPAGMRVTLASNIDGRLHRAYMRREFALLGQLDTRVLRSGIGPELLWKHRPVQLEAMISGRFPFLHERTAEYPVTPGAISIHRIETPAQSGTYHRSSWANRHAPGLQIIITAAAHGA